MRLSGRKPSAFTRRWTREHRVALLGLVMANIIVFAVQVVAAKLRPSICSRLSCLESARHARGLRLAIFYRHVFA